MPPWGSAPRTGRSGRRGLRPSTSGGPVCGSGCRGVERLIQIDRGRGELLPQICLRRRRGAIVRQESGQMSMQASHSMHLAAVKTVSISQFRQRCTSRAVCSALKPSSTSMLSSSKRRIRSTCCIFWRVAGL